jgi:hypothetical protein
MKVPPYWSKARHPSDSRKGRTDGVVACGWSFLSLEDAKKQAASRAKRIFDLVTSGQKPDTYDYSDRPVKEEIIEDLSDGNTQIALVTRNRYGALVLNSANVLFADIDFPSAGPKGILEWLVFMILPRKRDEKRKAMAVQTAQGVAQWAHDHPAHSFRMYRTQQGLRLLFTDKLYDPASEETLTILRGLNSDPMYVKLTQKHECFRARLTAKPWRCGCPRPPNSYPWDSAESERAYREWEKRYAGAEKKFRACEFIKAYGVMADSEAVKAIATAHDRLSRIESALPLA